MGSSSSGCRPNGCRWTSSARSSRRASSGFPTPRRSSSTGSTAGPRWNTRERGNRVPNPLEYLDRAIKIAAASKTAGLMEDLVQARREALQTQAQLEDLEHENKGLREKLR